MNEHKIQTLNETRHTRPTIGLLIENTFDIGEGFLTGILTGITTTAKAQDVNLICFVGGALHGLPGVEFDSQRNILYRIASANNLDGLIIISSIGNYTSQDELTKLYEHYVPLPVVTIGTPIEGTLKVSGDPEKGMTDLLAHLIEEHNYRRIAFIRGPEDNPEAEWRYQIYKDSLAQYNIPFDPDLVALGIFRFPSGAAAIELLLDQRQVEFDVIMGANDYMALGALEALQARGFVVPYDVAVVGFDNVSQSQNSIPPLTTVQYPLFEAGETAVHTMVAKLAGEPVAEELFFPAELIVRRSCGCMNPTMTIPTPAQPTMSSVGLLDPTRRDLMIANLMQSLDFAGLNAQEGAVQLVDAFLDEIVNQANGRFLATLDKLLRVVGQAEGDMASWQALVNILDRHVLGGIEQKEPMLRAATLLRETTIFITAEMQHEEAQQALRIERQDWLLHEIGQLLITMFDLPGLMDILAENIPRLGIPSCYLVLYEDPQPYHYPQPPPEWSRLVLACNENGRVPLAPNEQRFPTHKLLPDNMLSQEKSFTMMVEPLYFRDEQIGILFLERGPREGNVYELLRGQIASALKGALLLQAHKEAELELRQHRDHLDELVQERTKELATTNKQLRQEIGERQRMEEALRKSETQLRAIIETIPDLIWLKDPDGVFLICNSKVNQLYGKKESEIVGKTDYDFVDKELADHFRRKDLEAIAAGKPRINEEIVTFADDGHQALIETLKAPMFDSEGKLIGVLGIARDISERKRREQEIRDSKQMLSNVLDAIPVRVFWKDLDGNFLGCNQVFAQDVGKSNPEEVVGINDFYLSSAEQAELYRSDDRYVIESEQPKINYEEPQTTPDGTLAWLNTSKIPLRNSSGEIYGVLGTYEDITKRKQAEHLLKESNDRLQLALQAASMGTWEWDIVNNHLDWSPETYNIFGISADEFGRNYEAYLAFIPGARRQEIDEQFEQFLHEAQDAAVLQYEHEIVRRNGKVGWIEIRGALFLDDQGQLLRMIGVCADVTARKEVDMQLEAHTAELERSNQELQEFAYVASHDLQEPLRKIQAFGDRLQHKYYADLDDKGRNYIDRMQNAAARMQALIVDLLAFSRIRTHTQPFARVDLARVIKYVLLDLEIAVAEIGATIEVSDLPVLDADALQMRQLFQNLLGNALKFHRPEVPLKVTVTQRIIEGYCEITVADNGIGFDQQYEDRIFNVFERLHNREAYSGTGVGLAICRRIVERHGGDIRVQSKLGEGATFIIRILTTQPADSNE